MNLLPLLAVAICGCAGVSDHPKEHSWPASRLSDAAMAYPEPWRDTLFHEGQVIHPLVP